MKCPMCGRSGARVRRVMRPYGKGRAAYVIEGVPCVSCRNCGQSFFTARTLEKVEKIRAHWRELAKTRSIPVVRFGIAS